MQYVRKPVGKSQIDNQLTILVLRMLYKLDIAPSNIIDLGIDVLTMGALSIYVYDYENRLLDIIFRKELKKLSGGLWVTGFQTE